MKHVNLSPKLNIFLNLPFLCPSCKLVLPFCYINGPGTWWIYVLPTTQQWKQCKNWLGMDVNRVYLLFILVLSPGMNRTSKIICDHRFVLVFVNRTRTTQRMAVLQQGNEVLSHLNLFMNVTQHLKTPECMSQQLKQLTRSIRAVHGLVNKAWKQANNNTQEAFFVPSDSVSTISSDIMDIFHRFVKLLQGKVTFLLNTLCDVSSR
ncbi:uncharacterized protein LOC122935019 isoform X2 [Bufo gargarizans]|uniref:uncharacterized protein LOC122935019 isoform X2 n=1 Tax=Bufo gargarizans TaxID=30331 RepID=UPI001CF372A5|nr:uncharacterized protein LOC122935019 isoform X2 [Bufo gargarizans]